MKAKKYTIYAVLIVLIAIGIYALTAFQRGGSSLSADQSSSIPTAYVESDTLNASFKMAGRIDQMLVNEGDKVKKGQVLAHLESRELEDKVKQAQAALLAAKSNVSKAKAGVLQAQAGVGQAQATVSAAQAKKSQGTTAVGVTAQASSSQIEQAQAAAAAAKAKLDALKSGARPQELEQAQVSVKAAKEMLDLTAKNLERAKKLQEAGAATQASLDQATLDHQQAEAKYNSASQQLNMVR
ncbi:HlyD family secretion protein, partial [Paenibacillus maysiensis]|uniref:HlyD family secretion protein n=1 Tax=Paenibacillus maysiensis TaxID=1155954 RepID=UPI00046FF175